MTGNIKKAISTIVLVIIMLVFVPTASYAADENEWNNLSDNLNKLTSETLVKNDIDDFKLSQLKDMNFTDAVKYLYAIVMDEVKKPVKTFTLILCVTGLFSISGIFVGDKFSLSGDMLRSTVCVYALCTSLSDCISTFGQYIRSLDVFIRAVCPVVCVIEAVSGHSGSVLAYKLGVTAASEALNFMCSDVAKSFIYAFFALCACSSLSPFFDLSAITGFVMKTITAVLGATGTVFTGFLSVKKVFGNVSDTLAVRSVKFTLGSLIPIVGPSVAEGISSVAAGVKAASGAAAVTVTAVMVLICIPLLVRLFVWNITVRLIKCTDVLLCGNSHTDIYGGFIDFIKLMTALCVFSLYICCACTLMLGLSGVD